MGRVFIEALVVLLCSCGCVFFLGGTVGILRCPDLYTRLHPSTKGDTLGACSVIFALCLHLGATFTTVKLLAIAFFLLLSSAVCGHAIGRSALKSLIEPWHKPGVEPWPEEFRSL